MRRDQADANSQPRRNISLNPSFETAQGTVNIRTNLCLNPSFEVSSGINTVRTNLCWTPRGIYAFADYNGPANQTITPNVTGFPANPDGFTTANRVSYSTGANPGVTLINPVTSGTQYTIQAWIYHESVEPTTGVGGFAQAGVASMGSPPPMTAGVWQKVTWTYTASGTSQIGYRISSAAGGTGAFLITGVMIEAAPTVNTFFDGTTAAAGDFTYAWTGTVDASASIQKAPNCQYWSAVSTSVNYQTATGAFAGTKAGAVVTKGANGDGIYVSDITVTPGLAYTFSAYIKITSAVPNLSLDIRWKDSGNGTLSDSILEASASLVVGNWVRISATAIAPANAATAQSMIRIYATHTATTFYADAVMFEASSALSPYFDGSYAAALDFTYAWAGAAHQSISYQRAPGIAQLQVNYYSAAIQSTDWSASGTKSLRLIPNGVFNESFAGFIGNFGSLGTLERGKTYTAFATLRLTAPLTGTLNGRALQMVYRQDTNRIAQVQGANVAGVQQLRFSFTVGAAATSGFVELFNGAGPGGGDVWWDNLAVVEGNYVGDYVDGAQPLSKWDGAANASTSVGYPPQLQDIAGKPAVDLTGIASTGGVAIPVDPFTARTIYVVYETTGFTANYNTCMYYGVAASKGFILQTAGAGSSSLANRFDFPGGSANGAIVMANGRLTRRSVAAFAFADGLMTVKSCLNGGTEITTFPNPGTGWDDGRAQTMNGGTEIKPVRALVYYADHDRATRVAISRYLGNKYGVSVA